MPTRSRSAPVFSRAACFLSIRNNMALRDVFKFRDLPESDTSKPFLEHLEDLRWTIVKMAITLLVAMIVCFTFRSSLVQILQRPLREVDAKLAALRALG